MITIFILIKLLRLLTEQGKLLLKKIVFNINYLIYT